MSGSFVNRLGSSPEEGVKAPVATITSVNIALSGAQDIDGYQTVAGERVLVRAQTDPTENGIYDVSNSAWTRSTDFNAANDVVPGVLVLAVSDSNLYQAAFSGPWDPGVTDVTFVKIDLSGAVTGNEFVPLAGTDVNFPVTGPIKFRNSLGDEVYQMGTDIFGPESFGFATERNGTSFIIATKNDAGVVQGFSFTDEGQFTLPSNSGSNSEAWRMGAGSVLGDDDVLIFAPVNALGNITTHPIAFVVSPAYTFVMNASGYLEAPRATVAGDPDLVLTTKAYVDALLPPGGGEANTASSPGVSGEDLVMAKVGIDLQFKKLIAGTDITLTAGADGITIDGGAGAGGLPAGLLNQTLRNDAGTNTYVATDGLLVDAAGQVSVGPAAVAPAHPLTINGNAAVISGGHFIMNNPANSTFSELYTDASNRLQMVSAAGGGVDIHGSTSNGAAVNIKANSQDVFVANGSVKSWAQILHGGDVHLRTIDAGVEVHGLLRVKDFDLDNLYLQSDAVGTDIRNTMVVRNQDATESFMIVNASGNVSIGPGSVDPLVPLQLSGQMTILNGGQIALNNPANTSTGTLKNQVSNRVLLEGPAGGAVDIHGPLNNGAAVNIKANNQDVFIASGSTQSWAQILHGGVVRMRTVGDGVDFLGRFDVRNLADDTQLFTVENTGDTSVNGTMSALIINTALGNITSASQCESLAATPTQDQHLTRKDYVDGALGSKADNSLVMHLAGTEQVSGKKEFNGGLTVGNPGNQPGAGVAATFAQSILLENLTSASAPNLVNAFSVIAVDSSDITLKTNITDTIYGLADVMRLRAVDFDWISNGVEDSGFIAQEVQLVIPECTPVNPDGLLGFKDRPIIAALVKAVQELEARLVAAGL